MLTETEIRDLEARLRLDRNALDEAIAEQADLYYRVARAYSEANDAAETAKAALDSTDSTVALGIREAAERAQQKTTEGRIAEQVLTSPEHAAALEAYQLARAQARALDDLREAYRQRADAIKVEAQLYTAQYFTISAVRTGDAKVTAGAAAEGREALHVRRRKLSSKG